MEHQLLFVGLLLAFSVVVESLTSERDIAALCQISEPWEMLPHEHQCQRFYVCTGDPEVPFQEFSCPAEYHFNRELKICVPGACSDDNHSSLPTCGTTINHVERVSNDCSRYLQCLSGGAYAVAKCSAGKYFDSNRKACLPVAVTAAHQCSCVLPDNATLANSNDCETYFRCQAGEAVLVQCPSGEYFEAKVGTCLPDYTGICLEKPTMPPPPERALALDECIRTGSRLAPHRRDCRRYYVCARMRVIEMRCPRGQYFDVVHRLCSLDRQSECNVSTMVEIEQKPQQPHKEDHNVENNVNLELESAEDLSLPAALEVNAKQPPNERDVVNNYDKFSSKFVSL